MMKKDVNENVFMAVCMAVLVVLLAWIAAGRLTAVSPVEETETQGETEVTTEAPSIHPPVKELNAVVYAAPQTVKTAPVADVFAVAETYTAPPAQNSESADGNSQSKAGVIAKGNSSVEVTANPKMLPPPERGESIKPSERSREPFSPPVERMSQRRDTSGGYQSGMRLLGTYSVTGYDICVQCCGKVDGVTASGAVATVGRTCACNAFPFGTVLYIEGIGYRTVEDRGGMSGGGIDVLCASHAECRAITGRYTVYVCE